MALMYSKMIPLGLPAPDFSLPDSYGKVWSLRDFNDSRAVIVVFMCNHCPYVKAVLDRLIGLQLDYKGKGVQLIGINSNDVEKYPDDSLEAMKELIAVKKIPFPYLIDSTQDIARAYNAVCTPDIFVYGMKRTLIYRGRVDDNWQEPERVDKEDLKNALNLVLSGKTVVNDQIPSMGCSIKWKKD